MSTFDLREFLGRADAAGLLTTITGADRDLEIGAASQLNYRRAVPQALLFDDGKGFPHGTRVLPSSLSGPALLGLGLGMGPDYDDARLVQKLRGLPAQWLADAA